MCYYPRSLRLAVLLILAISALTITADEAASQSPDNYQLMVVPESFEYVLAPGDTLTDSIHVYEDSGQVVDFEITNNSNWLQLPLFFTCPKTPATIDFGVTAAGLTPGLYYDTIPVTIYINCETYHSHVTVPVQMTVSGGTETGLASEPSSFHFVLNQGDTLIGESLYIYDIEGNSYNFWTYNFTNWLYVDTMEASPLYTPELISVDVYTDMMSPGVYYDSILVFADEASNSPLVIPATLTIPDDSSEYIVQTNPTWFFFDLRQGDVGLLAGGFIEQNFMDGMNAREFFYHSMGGRQGEVDTGVSTKISGYLYRRLANALKDLKVTNDGSVRTASDNLVQFVYGEDGVFPTETIVGNVNIVEEALKKQSKR